MKQSRRQLLKAGVTTTAAMGAGYGVSRLVRAGPSSATKADVELTLRASPGQVSLNRRETAVWRFEGKLDAGPPDTLSPSGGYLGPVIRVRPGQRVGVRFQNGLDEPSIVHWHGLDVAQENDGHPRLAVPTGGRYTYNFRVTNRPGTYWYHPHAHQRTGPQVFAGLAGMFLVVDDDDARRGLPSGTYDVPLVLQDRRIGADGQLFYGPNMTTGFLGDRRKGGSRARRRWLQLSEKVISDN